MSNLIPLEDFESLIREQFNGTYFDEMSSDTNGHEVYISASDLYYYADKLLQEASNEQH